MLSGEATELQVWNIRSSSEVLKIQKKGDFKINTFTVKDGFIAYSDSVDTQVFHFDQESLVLKKVSRLLCA